MTFRRLTACSLVAANEQLGDGVRADARRGFSRPPSPRLYDSRDGLRQSGPAPSSGREMVDRHGRSWEIATHPESDQHADCVAARCRVDVGAADRPRIRDR